MNNIEEFAELQTLWASKGVGEVAADNSIVSTDTLVLRLKKFQSFQDKINRIKLIALIGILSSLFFTVQFLDVLPYAYFGLLIITISTTTFFSYYLRNQFKISKVPFNTSSKEFITITIRLLNKQNGIFKTPFILFGISLLIGINILIYNPSVTNDIATLIKYHAILTGMVAISSFMGYIIRRLRINKEVQPILDELSRIKENL